MANKDDIYPGCPGDCSPTYVRELQKAAAQADLQARAREIAAGLNASEREAVRYYACNGVTGFMSYAARERILNRYTDSPVLDWQHGCCRITDLGRAVAAVLAEVDRG